MADEIMTNEADGLVGTSDEQIESGKSGLDAKSFGFGALVTAGAVAVGCAVKKFVVDPIRKRHAKKRAEKQAAKDQGTADLDEKKESLLEKVKAKAKEKITRKEEPMDE